MLWLDLSIRRRYTYILMSSEMYNTGQRDYLLGPNAPEVQPDAERLAGWLAVLHPLWAGLSLDAPTGYDWAALDGPTLAPFYAESVDDTLSQLEAVSGYFEKAPCKRSSELSAVTQLVQPEKENKEQGISTDPWHNKAMKLLGQAEAMSSSDRLLFVGALVCSLLSAYSADRAAFLEAVYERGLAERMASACAQSEVACILDVTQESDTNRSPVMGVYRIANAAAMFMLDKKLFGVYMCRVKDPQQRLPVGKRDLPRNIEEELVDSITRGEADEELRMRAAIASMQGYKVRGRLYDPAKIERFALQRMFIAAQAKLVLGKDITDTPLARELADLHSQTSLAVTKDTESELVQLQKLEVDIGLAFGILGWRVIQAFSSGIFDSPEHQAAMRFRELQYITKQCYLISQHVMGPDDAFMELDEDPALRAIVNEADDAQDPQEIWTISATGAAVSTIVTDALRNIVLGIKHAPNISLLTAEEVLLFAHEHRRELLGFATRHQADLPHDIVSEAPVVIRNARGRLEQLGKAIVTPKRSHEQYTSATLGCPALRVEHGGTYSLNPWEQALLGKSSYLDHALAIILNEAYRRGLFDSPSPYVQRPLGVMRPVMFI